MGRLIPSAALAAIVACLAAAPAAAEPDAAELFELCVQCHGSAGEGNAAALAPAIAGLDEWYVKAQLHKFQGGVRGTHPDDVGGMRMYPMARSFRGDDEIDALARYVAQLPVQRPAATLEGDVTRGKVLYTPCAACHGPDAAGLEALAAPALNHGSDWYFLTQLQHFKDGVRGTNPADVTGARMRPMAMILADEQAMRDVIAYALSLAK